MVILWMDCCLSGRKVKNSSIRGDHAQSQHMLGSISIFIVSAQPINASPQDISPNSYTPALSMRITELLGGNLPLDHSPGSSWAKQGSNTSGAFLCPDQLDCPHAPHVYVYPTISYVVASVAM